MDIKHWLPKIISQGSIAFHKKSQGPGPARDDHRSYDHGTICPRMNWRGAVAQGSRHILSACDCWSKGHPTASVSHGGVAVLFSRISKEAHRGSCLALLKWICSRNAAVPPGSATNCCNPEQSADHVTLWCFLLGWTRTRICIRNHMFETIHTYNPWGGGVGNHNSSMGI